MRKLFVLLAVLLVAGTASAQLQLLGNVTPDLQYILDANGVPTALQVSTTTISTVGIAGSNSDTFTVGVTNNTALLTTDGTNTGVFMCKDAAGAANCSFDTTGAGTIGLGSADVTTLTLTAEDITLSGSDDILVTATDDLTLNGGSAGSVINVGTNTHGNVINVGTDNTAKDTITIGSALDDVFVGGNKAGAEAAAGNVCAETCVGAICQTVCTLTAVNLAITDPGGAAAYGGVKIYDFPAGHINRLGIVADLTLTEASATIDANFDGDISFGSTAADAVATLHNPTTEDDWALTVATTTAVASVAVADTQSAVTEQTICDGHATACDLYLNVEIDDGNITTGGADALAVDGTITITWLNLGDN